MDYSITWSSITVQNATNNLIYLGVMMDAVGNQCSFQGIVDYTNYTKADDVHHTAMEVALATWNGAIDAGNAGNHFERGVDRIWCLNWAFRDPDTMSL